MTQSYKNIEAETAQRERKRERFIQSYGIIEVDATDKIELIKEALRITPHHSQTKNVKN